MNSGTEPLKLQAPIPCPRQDVLCLGLNYSEHAAEAAGYSDEAFSSEKATAIFFPNGSAVHWKTADEIPYPPRLAIASTVNGELRQSSNTGMLIHPIDEILCELTAGMTLQAGTVIATGTPKGVSMGMEQPVFLKKGDVVTCTIEKIGSLTTLIG